MPSITCGGGWSRSGALGRFFDERLRFRLRGALFPLGASESDEGGVEGLVSADGGVASTVSGGVVGRVAGSEVRRIGRRAADASGGE